VTSGHHPDGKIINPNPTSKSSKSNWKLEVVDMILREDIGFGPDSPSDRAARNAFFERASKWEESSRVTLTLILTLTLTLIEMGGISFVTLTLILTLTLIPIEMGGISRDG